MVRLCEPPAVGVGSTVGLSVFFRSLSHSYLQYVFAINIIVWYNLFSYLRNNRYSRIVIHDGNSEHVARA